MKNKNDKSLIEVWDMKDAAWKAFQESGISNYSDYIVNSVKEIKEKYNLKYLNEIEKEKVN
jgi:predicted phosphatase